MNSKRKGKIGELEFSKYLKARGYQARRGQQFSGGPDSPDIISNFPAHFEVKRCQRLNIYKAMQQAVDECGGQTPIIAHRNNNNEWMVTLKADDFFNIVNEKTS